MPRDSFYKLPHERRERLLEAVVAELESCGTRDASMNRILERAGFSKGVAYHYFEDRNDLLATVLRDQLARSLDTVQVNPLALSAESFWDDLAHALTSLLEPGALDPRLITVVRAVWALPAEQRSHGAMGALWMEMTGLLRAVVTRGRQIGTVRTDLPEDLLVSASMALGEACDRWFIDHWESSPATAMRDLGLGMLGLVRRILEPPAFADQQHSSKGSKGRRTRRPRSNRRR